MVQQTVKSRIEELVHRLKEGVEEQGELNKAYMELVALAEAEELTMYGGYDFSIYLTDEQNTTDMKVAIINKGYYREYANLMGLSQEDYNEEIDRGKLREGLKAFIANKLIPWIAWDEETDSCEFTEFYITLKNELAALNTRYLQDEEVAQELKGVTDIIHRLTYRV